MIQGQLPWTAAPSPSPPRWRGPWEVIVDPSQTFLGSRFNWFDLKWGATFRSWPEGIVFRHVSKGTTIQYSNGELIEIGGDNGSLWPVIAAAV